MMLSCNKTGTIIFDRTPISLKYLQLRQQTGADRQFRLAGLERIRKDQQSEENGMFNLSIRK
jgi:hypothetical protein